MRFNQAQQIQEQTVIEKQKIENRQIENRKTVNRKHKLPAIVETFQKALKFGALISLPLSPYCDKSSLQNRLCPAMFVSIHHCFCQVLDKHRMHKDHREINDKDFLGIKGTDFLAIKGKDYLGIKDKDYFGIKDNDKL